MWYKKQQELQVSDEYLMRNGQFLLRCNMTFLTLKVMRMLFLTNGRSGSLQEPCETMQYYMQDP